MSFHKTKKRRWFWYLFSLSVFFLVAGGFLFAVMVQNISPEDVFNSPIVEKRLGDTQEGLIDAVPVILGFDEKRTYLLLFLNNTELRPGGGFIGTYAVIDVEKGRPTVRVVEGADVLGGRAPESWQPTPPPILKRELKVDRWYFRDSNWSPDFAASSERAVTFFAGEGGEGAQDIDAVLAFTPTVVEKVLQKTGPITVEGITFTAENFTEKLVREVEYDFAKKGIPVEERKKIIQPLFEEMIKRAAFDFFKDSDSYVSLGQDLVSQKHILLYSNDAAINTNFAPLNPFGKVLETEHDYLLWVDANLAALKTDHAMQRHLVYHLEPDSQQEQFKASATMHYNHTGKFDWRTTRYRTYARVYVPLGAKLTDAVIQTPYGSTEVRDIDQGIDHEKQWFGTFVEIEPGAKKAVKFSYTLPERIRRDVTAGNYQLDVQKQLGSVAHSLTLDLDFGTNITDALPAEKESDWGDESYKKDTDLLVDRQFNIRF